MTRIDLVARITEYLTGGGLFNPEMADHDAVRDLLIDCRSALAASEEGEGAPPTPRCDCCGHAPHDDRTSCGHREPSWHNGRCGCVGSTYHPTKGYNGRAGIKPPWVAPASPPPSEPALAFDADGAASGWAAPPKEPEGGAPRALEDAP